MVFYRLVALGGLFSVSAKEIFACPNCKDGLLENGRSGLDLARGFELSIYLMLGAPMFILMTLGLVFLWQIRSAQHRGTYPDTALVIAQAESQAALPSG